jgi:transposase
VTHTDDTDRVRATEKAGKVKKPGHPRFTVKRRCTRPEQKTVICPVHGAMDADVNGALNIFTRAGLGSGQATPAA